MRGIGRIRLRLIPDASAESLHPFILDSVTPSSAIHTDGWRGYCGLETKGCVHQITVLQGKKQPASELLPRVHLVISLLKRRLMGPHQGAVSHKHLDYYLDEFTFRFNRRKSASRGKLFLRAYIFTLTSFTATGIARFSPNPDETLIPYSLFVLCPAW